MENSTPRPEYPQPQFERENWVNLNGEWQFAFDFGKSGLDRHFEERDALDQTITVPFCPESELSGIGCKRSFAGRGNFRLKLPLRGVSVDRLARAGRMVWLL